MSRYNWLHQNISTETRLALVADWQIAEIVSAPAHAHLRNLAYVRDLIAQFRGGYVPRPKEKKLLIGIFTADENGGVVVKSVECLDGHHRLIAALAAGVWRVIGDIPLALLDARVNGQPARTGHSEDRWVPYGAAEAAGLVKREVSASEGAAGPTAAIDGGISARDERFAPPDRGVRLSQVLSSAGL